MTFPIQHQHHPDRNQFEDKILPLGAYRNAGNTYALLIAGIIKINCSIYGKDINSFKLRSIGSSLCKCMLTFIVLANLILMANIIVYDGVVKWYCSNSVR
jgi:hypothetical protein